MTHVLILGMTESGKTTLAKAMANQYKANGTPVIVCDPLHDPGWNADFVTGDAREFLAVAERNKSCALFLDESGETVGRYNDEMFWLATRARHYGHKSHFVTQRGMQLGKIVRDQCRHLFCFCVSFDDAKLLANEYNKPQLKEAHTLKQFEYFYTSRFGDLKRFSIRPQPRSNRSD